MKYLQSVLLLVIALANSACAGTSGVLRNDAEGIAAAIETPRGAASLLTVGTHPSIQPGTEEPLSVVVHVAGSPAGPDSESARTESGAQTAPDQTAFANGASEPDQAEIDAVVLYGHSVVPDPWESYNRRVHRFNNVVDRRLLRPLANGYAKVVPAPFRSTVTRFLHNLGEPTTAINQALQGDPALALRSLGRFVLNTTIGIAGVFDPASRMGLPDRGSEDFGQTLAVWGWRDSRYLVIPLLGPRTVRDAISIGVDQRTAPSSYANDARAVAAIQLLDVVDGRTQLLGFDEMRERAYDDYVLVRDAWLQRRGFQIERNAAGD